MNRDAPGKCIPILFEMVRRGLERLCNDMPATLLATWRPLGTDDALRCIGHRSTLHQPSQRGATGFAVHCIFHMSILPSLRLSPPTRMSASSARPGSILFSSSESAKRSRRAFCPLPRNLQRKSEEQTHSPYRISQNSIFSSLGPWMKKYFAPLSQKSIWLTLSLSIV